MSFSYATPTTAALGSLAQVSPRAARRPETSRANVEQRIAARIRLKGCRMAGARIARWEQAADSVHSADACFVKQSTDYRRPATIHQLLRSPTDACEVFHGQDLACQHRMIRPEVTQRDVIWPRSFKSKMSASAFADRRCWMK